MTLKKIVPYPRLTARKDKGEQVLDYELNDKLSHLQFWCGNNELHIQKPDTYKAEYCCFTHVVGLPTHPATNLPLPLTPYQIECYNAIAKKVAKPDGVDPVDWSRESHMFHILKGRQMGFTEIILRIIQYFCFTRYMGKNVGIIAATNGDLAKKDLRRFYKLFGNIKGTINVGMKNKKIVLTNDCVIEAFPASEEALTGDTNYAAIFMDESAKWKNLDDRPIFNSIMPIVRSNGADLFLVSTPKSPIKMFYKIYRDPQDFIKLEYDIWRSEGNLYIKSQILNMLASSKEDPSQEYLCKFTHGESAIFGKYVEENRGTNWKEWDVDDDDEDDGYVESEEDRDAEWN